MSAEAAPRCRRGHLYPRRARAARIPDLQPERLPDSAGRSAQARARAGLQPRDRRPLPLRRAQRQGRGIPAPVRLSQSQEPGRRRAGMVGPGGSQDAEVLKTVVSGKW